MEVGNAAIALTIDAGAFVPNVLPGRGTDPTRSALVLGENPA
jgi:hypothetical protein